MAKTVRLDWGFREGKTFSRGPKKGIWRRNIAEKIVSLPTAKLIANYLGDSCPWIYRQHPRSVWHMGVSGAGMHTEWDREWEARGGPTRLPELPVSRGAGREELYYKILGRILPWRTTFSTPYYLKIRFRSIILPLLKMRHPYPGTIRHVEVQLSYLTPQLWGPNTILIAEAAFCGYSDNNSKYRFYDEIYTLPWCTCAFLIAHST